MMCWVHNVWYITALVEMKEKTKVWFCGEHTEEFQKVLVNTFQMLRCWHLTITSSEQYLGNVYVPTNEDIVNNHKKYSGWLM